LTAVSALDSNTARISFIDGADDEFGIEVLRANQAPLNCDDGSVVGAVSATSGLGSAVTLDDATAQAETTHWYWVRAYNAAGAACSTDMSVTMPIAPPAVLQMSLNGYKVKGRQQVDVIWTNGDAAGVDVYRDGAFVGSGSGPSGTYVDNIGVKGGGSYQYHVCVTGTSNCTAAQSVAF
jgi:hypothetical protein